MWKTWKFYVYTHTHKNQPIVNPTSNQDSPDIIIDKNFKRGVINTVCKLNKNIFIMSELIGILTIKTVTIRRINGKFKTERYNWKRNHWIRVNRR